jgi:hypothetical protein
MSKSHYIDDNSTILMDSVCFDIKSVNHIHFAEKPVKIDTLSIDRSIDRRLFQKRDVHTQFDIYVLFLL